MVDKYEEMKENTKSWRTTYQELMTKVKLASQNPSHSNQDRALLDSLHKAMFEYGPKTVGGSTSFEKLSELVDKTTNKSYSDSDGQFENLIVQLKAFMLVLKERDQLLEDPSSRNIQKAAKRFIKDLMPDNKSEDYLTAVEMQDKSPKPK